MLLPLRQAAVLSVLSTICLAVVLALTPSRAVAAPLVLDFTGTATFVSGIFAGEGGAVSGSLHLDSALVDSAAADPNRDEFRLSAGANQGLDLFMTVEVGNAMWTTEDNWNPPFTLRNLQQNDGPTADIWFFEIPPDSIPMGDSEARISLRSDGSSDALLAGSGGLSGMVLVPMAEAFDTAEGFFVARDATSDVVGRVNFVVDSISAPEPTTGVGVALLLAVRLCSGRVRSNRCSR